MRFFAYLLNRLSATKAAVHGLVTFFRTEYSAWIHAVAMATAIGLGFAFDISREEWIALFVLFGVVLTTEILNTAIELICDFVHPDHNEKVGTIKDIAAGGVLFSALISMVVGALIFLPKI